MNPLLIVALIFVIVIIFMVLRYLISDKYKLTDLTDGTSLYIVKSDDLANNGTDVPSSNFAYSIWVYINNWNYRYGEEKVIFGRMGQKSSETNGSVDGVNGKDPCPLVVLGSMENNVSVHLSCFPGSSDIQLTGDDSNSIIHKCTVNNIPIQKWVQIAVSVYGRTMDLYMNGKLVKTCILPGIANINDNADVMVTPGGGFEGWTSKLQYFPGPLNPQDVWNLYNNGYDDLGNMFSNYQLKLSLIENGNESTSYTI